MEKIEFWVGNYAAPDRPGVFRCAFDPAEGFTVRAAYAGPANPSFLLEHPVFPVLYTVEETEDGAVSAWKPEGEQLAPLGRVMTGGASPCHLSLSADGRWLYCANYTGGSVAVIRLDDKGVPAERTDLVRHHGRGPNTARQEKAHAHCVYPYHGRIGVCDLGEDRIYLYENREGKLAETACLQAKAGSGPRHLASHPAHPDKLYCVAELSGGVSVWQETAPGRFEKRQEVSALPEGFSGENTAAAIRFTEDGGRLLVSQRGADGIAVMPVFPDGRLGRMSWSSCVRGPRDFLVCGDTVLAGSQRDGEIRAYRPEADGLRDLGFRLALPEPVCIQKALR
jgi:6-phosphogluconolactonase